MDFLEMTDFISILMRGVSTAFFEEWVWRVVLQGIAVQWMGPLLGISVTSFLFWGCHFHQFGFSQRRKIEFIFFSLLLGFLYEWTHHFTLLVTVHAARNILTLFYRLGVLIVLMGLFVFPVAGHAEEIKMTLREAIVRGLAYNQSIQAKMKEVESEKQHVYEAVRSWLPRISFKVDTNYYKKDNFSQGGTGGVEIAPGISIPGSLLSSTGQAYFKSALGANFEQLLWDDGVVRGEWLRAVANLRLREAELAKEKQEVAKQVVQFFYDILITRRKMRSLTFLKKSREKSLNVFAKRFSSGKLEAIEKELDLAETNNELLEQQAKLKYQQMSFLQWVGYPSFHVRDGELLMEEPFDKLDKGLFPSAMSELEIAVAKTEALQAQSVIDGSGNKPSAQFYTDLNYYRTNEQWTKTFENLDRVLVAGVRLSWSFFDQGKTLARTSATRRAIQGSILEATQLKEQLEIEAKQVEAHIVSQELFRALLKKKLAMLSEKVSIIRRSASLGLSGELEWLNSQAEIEKTEAQRLEVEQSLLLSEFRLNQVKQVEIERGDDGNS